MSAKLLDGKVVAEAVLREVSERVERLKQQGVSVGLGTILIAAEMRAAKR